MAGLSAAAGIAVINSLANLGGYFGPDIIGFFRKLNGGFRGGLLAIGATLALSGAIALIVGRTSLVRASEEERRHPPTSLRAGFDRLFARACLGLVKGVSPLPVHES